MRDSLRIGLFGIGLDTYWSQFEGLLEKLLASQAVIASRLTALNCDVTDAGMVDNPGKAIEAASLFNRSEVDMVVLNIATYALSHNVLPLLQRISAPVLVFNLQPVKALDYEKFNAIGDRGRMTGEWLSLCQSCVTPELASVFSRAGLSYHLVSGYLDDDHAWNEISGWVEACRVKKCLRNTRIGVMGHYYNGMLDVYTDITRLAAAFGCHFELMELGPLKAFFRETTDKEAEKKISEFRRWFRVSPECSDDDLEKSARVSIALDKAVKRHSLGALAYYYEGEGDSEYEEIITSLIPGMTLLTGQNIPAAGECEVKNAVAMKIMDLFDAGGSFSEFYLMDYDKNEILLGHDGPAHFRISEGKVGLVPLPVFHGKPGKGLSIQMEVAKGPVTLLSVCQGGDGSTTLLCAEGYSVEGPTLQIANTNSRYRFPLPARDFVDRWAKAGPSHHCAIGVGNIASRIEKLSMLTGCRFMRIC